MCAGIEFVSDVFLLLLFRALMDSNAISVCLFSGWFSRRKEDEKKKNKLIHLFYLNMITLIRMPRHNFEMSLKIPMNVHLTIQHDKCVWVLETWICSRKWWRYNCRRKSVWEKWEETKELKQLTPTRRAHEPSQLRPKYTPHSYLFLCFFGVLLSLCYCCFCNLLPSIVQTILFFSILIVCTCCSHHGKEKGEPERIAKTINKMELLTIGERIKSDIVPLKEFQFD